MWEHPHHVVPGRDRPIEPWSAETGAARGSSRAGLPEPGQLAGAMEPVCARSGGQECVGVTCPGLEGLLWPKPSGTLPGAPLGHAGPAPMMPAGWRRAWTGGRLSPHPEGASSPRGPGARGAEGLGRGRPPRGRRAPAAGPRLCPGHGPVGANGGGGGPCPGPIHIKLRLSSWPCCLQ